VNTAHLVHGSWLRGGRAAGAWRGLRGGYQWGYTALNARLERLAFRQARLHI